ncbi:hypothetical protein F2P81_026153 [Scophthalmus maximus]|uniref:Uncharacterized protein n=1 Tax=Scophthalmus maximus TaxID=52904 RepID=A0A6A4RSK9_SCOMX|nr:hypothetical protein F2P81_026153 [Scophthalmus maximus]
MLRFVAQKSSVLLALGFPRESRPVRMALMEKGEKLNVMIVIRARIVPGARVRFIRKHQENSPWKAGGPHWFDLFATFL